MHGQVRMQTEGFVKKTTKIQVPNTTNSQKNKFVQILLLGVNKNSCTKKVQAKRGASKLAEQNELTNNGTSGPELENNHQDIESSHRQESHAYVLKNIPCRTVTSSTS